MCSLPLLFQNDMSNRSHQFILKEIEAKTFGWRTETITMFFWCWTTAAVDMSNPTIHKNIYGGISKWTWIEMVPSPSMSNSWKTSRNSSTCVDKIIWIRQKLKIKANCYHSHGDVIYLKLQGGVLEKKTQVWEIFQGQAPLSIYTSKHKSTRDDKRFHWWEMLVKLIWNRTLCAHPPNCLIARNGT